MKKVIKFHFFNSNPLIRLRFGTPCTHVGVEFMDGLYYESDAFKGNIKMFMVDSGKTPDYTVELFVDEYHYTAARREAEKILGSKYDYLAIIGFFLGTRTQNKSGFFCSELGRCVFEKATDRVIDLKRLMTPYDLYIACSAVQ